MSEDIKGLIDEMKSMRQDMAQVITAIKGDSEFNVDGVQQHVAELRKDVEGLKKDVHGLKNDRMKIVIWVSGMTAGLSLAGTKILNWIKP